MSLLAPTLTKLQSGTTNDYHFHCYYKDKSLFWAVKGLKIAKRIFTSINSQKIVTTMKKWEMNL